ncbi:MAG TPA: hypothetical protein VK211_08555 [Kamptonema sp.]|nr:hypothetical protein [Kamptonema sp.]
MKKEEFQPDETEIVQLNDEIAELKEMLREISRKLTRIETKVKRGLSSVPKSSELQVSQSTLDGKKSENLSAKQVLEVYEELRLKAKDGNEEEVKQQLSDMNLTDLNLLCWELGASVSRKNSSRKKMLDAILGKIKQSLMLSRHIDRQAL